MGRTNTDLPWDILPEHYPYRDQGCEVSPSCLRCPLPRCKHDDPGFLRRDARDRRDAKIMETRRRERLSVPQLAQRFRVSERTVFRAMRRARQQSPPVRPEGNRRVAAV